MKKKLLIILPIVIVVAIAVGYIGYRGYKNRQTFEFTDHLDDTAVTINEEALLYRELSFYVLYIEQKVERDARVYNPESPKDWWNSYLNGKFVSVQAAEAVMDMAVHDRIMYDRAIQDGITLTDEERAQMQFAHADFWEDLYDEQLERLPLSKEEIDTNFERIALGEKYQRKLAAEQGVNDFEYDFDGYEYKQMRDNEYKIKVDDNYKKLVFGEITLHHNKTNFINGWMSDSKKKSVR